MQDFTVTVAITVPAESPEAADDVVHNVWTNGVSETPSLDHASMKTLSVMGILGPEQ